MFVSPPPPTARGPLSSAVLQFIGGTGQRLPDRIDPATGSMLTDEDAQLALYCAYELHYRGFDVASDAEWDPDLLAFRQLLEARFESELRELVPTRWSGDDVGPADELRAVIDAGSGPSVSTFMEHEGRLWHFAEFAVHRSPYQLKEADAHTWGIPRYSGRSRAALVEIQMDEYGEGRPHEAHADLFADTMEALGLDPTYGAYLDHVPAVTLATTNLISFFGLHRRLLPALLGHLALFENTSVTPMGRYSRALERLGFGEDARRFYDVHVEADEHHGPLAATRLVGDFVAENPDARGDVMWGAGCVMALEERVARHLISYWAAERSSLRIPLPDSVVVGDEVATFALASL